MRWLEGCIDWCSHLVYIGIVFVFDEGYDFFGVSYFEVGPPVNYR